MKNVKRLPQPNSLARNSKNWTNELLSHIMECKETGTKPQDKFLNKYNKPDVRNALKKMYAGYCCYCEAYVPIVSFPHIEHRKPKAVYPEHTYDWENLHLSCGVCNSFKGDKYDEREPILDAACDEVIEDHLTYSVTHSVGVLREPRTKRGKTTVDHTKLNRDELAIARLHAMCGGTALVMEIRKHRGELRSNTLLEELGKMCEKEYGSLIKYIKDNLL